MAIAHQDDSTPVPLKDIDYESGSDFEFPRLSAHPYADPSKFLIKILNAPGGTSMLEVSAFSTVAEIKRKTIRSVKAIELTKIEFSGEILNDEQTLSTSGVSSGSELSLMWPEDDTYEAEMEQRAEETQEEEQVPRGAVIAFEAEKRDLMNKARARVLFEWNGFTPDGEMLGLPLHPKCYVMIGRVVNQDWYEGYLPDDLDRYGYIPRNFVELESLYDEEFRKKLGFAAQELPLSTTAPDPELPPHRHRHFLDRFLDPIIGIFSHKIHKQQQFKGSSKQISGPTPRIPPSPFPPKPRVPTLDLLEQGNRVRINFHLEQPNANEYPVIRVVLSLVSAPQTRISYATVELEFEHDTIIELEPKREEGLETEVHHSSSITNELSANAGVNQVPVGIDITGSHTVAKVAEFSRRTRGTVVGDGEGSSRAYWVFKEDPGEAGRFGLDPEHKMLVKLHARPVRVDYQVNAKVVTDDGGTGGWFGTKRLSSGRQRFYLLS